MTMLDIAQAMRGKLRDGYSAPQAGGAAMTSEMAYGTARADSVGGFVEIVMDNMPAGADPDDYAFEVACDAPISAGDRVALVTINGTSKAVSTATVAQIAQSANATATATNQYFFHDATGAHVATVAGDPDSGRNVTLNSYGLLFRDGATDLAEFTPTEIKLGENCTLGPSSGDVGTVGISLMNDMASLAMKRLYVPNSNGQGGTLLPCLVIESTNGPVRIPWLWVSGIMQLEFDGIAAYNSTLGGMRSINSSRGGAATLSSSAAQSTVAGTDTKLQLRTLAGSIVGQGTVISGDNSLFHAVRNVNIYGDDMYCRLDGTVLVSAQVYCQNMTSNNNLVVSIYKNSTKLCEVGVSPANSSGMATAVIPPRAVSVSAGDTFALYAKSTTAVTNGIPIGGAALTVQYI